MSNLRISVLKICFLPDKIYPMNQHYVPKVYLKHFETNRRMLYALSNSAHKRSPHVREFTKTQLSYLPDFYTINNTQILWRLGLTDKDAIEKDYNVRVENRLEKLITQLVSPQRKLPWEVAEEVIRMLLSLKQRNPVFRQAFQNPQLILDAFNHRFNQVFQHQAIFEEILKREGHMNFNEFVEFGWDKIYKIAHDPNTPQDMHTEGIVNLHQNEETAAKEVATMLLGCEWFIFETTSQHPFITSDNPGFCLDVNEHVHNLNFATGAGFFFPLTPKYMLLITAHSSDQTNSVKQIHHRSAQPNVVNMVNRGTFLVSYKKVLSNDENALRYVWHDMSRFMPHLTDTPVYKRNENRDQPSY